MRWSGCARVGCWWCRRHRALKDLDRNADYREALLAADLAITDSGYMVLLWNLMKRDHVKKLSGTGVFCGSC